MVWNIRISSLVPFLTDLDETIGSMRPLLFFVTVCFQMGRLYGTLALSGVGCAQRQLIDGTDYFLQEHGMEYYVKQPHRV